MIIRALALAGGLGGAATFSQYPEFSQQYIQRLGGQVDALNVVVADFEASAMRAGLTRTTALEQMTSTPFLENRQADMRRTFRRHAVLSDNLAQLRAASPLDRLTMPQRLGDPATLAATWADYKPAMPLSVAGLASAGTGFAAGWLALRAILALLAAPFRRKQTALRKSQPRRLEPALRVRNSSD